MNMKLLHVFGAALIAIWPMGAAAQGKCTKSPCNVAITVTGSGTACSIKVQPEDLVVSKVNDADIVWEIKTEGWGFCKILGDGIFLKSADPESQFSEVYGTSDGKTLDEIACKKKYHWKDKNSNNRKYPYMVVIHDTGGRRCQRDPAIVNDMSGTAP